MVTLRQPPPGTPDPDDDPTGMRALLSSLPEPGPMPADLVARITASIAAEQQHRAVAVPIHSARSHRPVWRTAGLAAAAAVVIGVGGGSLLTGTAPGNIGALFGGSDSAAGSTAEVASRENAGAGAPDMDAKGGAAIDSSTAPVSIHHTATAYSSATFDEQARALLSSGAEVVPPLSAESPTIGPIATEVGLRSCLGALTGEPFSAATADLGSFDGKPAAVVVLTTRAGHTAYAVQRSCSTGHPALLAGPVTLP